MSGDQADGRGGGWCSGLFVILAALGTAWTEDAARTHRFLPRHGHRTHAARQGSAAQPTDAPPARGSAIGGVTWLVCR